MKLLNNLLFLSVFFGISSLGFSQKVFSVDYQNQADVKVFVVKYENQADLKVFKVKYQNQADLKVFFVDYENQAGWRNNAKKHLMY